jgi:hypothetical protein
MRIRTIGNASCISRSLLVLALCLAFVGLLRPQNPNQQLRVDYTGGLYGYFRDDAPTFHDTDGLVGHFIQVHGGEGHLLLGMGDNFGPEFGASIQEEDRANCGLPTDPSERLPQALYKDDLRVAKSAECDNVANFLLKAGYRVIVPGREDFMYGSGWLRMMAANLRAARSADNGDKRLTVLAANLRLRLQSSSDPEGSSSGKLKNLCPLLFAPDRSLLSTGKVSEGGQSEDTSFEPATCSTQTADSPPELLDVLDRMTLVVGNPQIEASITDADTYYAEVRKSPDVTQHRNQILTNQLDQLRLMSWGLARTRGLLAQITILQKKFNAATPAFLRPADLVALRDCVASLSDATSPCPVANTSAAQGEAPTRMQNQPPCTFHKLPNSGDLTDLNAFANGLLRVFATICSTEPSPSTVHTDDRLIVDSEAGRAGIRALLHAIAREQWNVGYTIASTNPDETSPQTLIIGVVGESTLQDVSRTNREFCFSVQPDSGSAAVAYNYCDRKGEQHKHENLQAQVYELNPVQTIVALARAAKLTHPQIQSVIVMAQMPHTEAEELAAAVKKEYDRLEFVVARPCDSRETSAGDKDNVACSESLLKEQRIPQVAFILSEAQDDHASGDFEMFYSRGIGLPPVLTPRHAYGNSHGSAGLLDDPASIVTYTTNLAEDSNSLESPEPARKRETGSNNKNALFSLTNEELNTKLKQHSPKPVQASVLLAEKILGIPEDASPDPPSPYASIGLGDLRDGTLLTVDKLLREAGCASANPAAAPACDLAIQRLLLQMLQRGARLTGDPLNDLINPAGELADVSLLQSRDIWLNKLPGGYAGAQERCRRWLANKNAQASAEAYCELRVALDMILWKGDYASRAQVKGSDLTDMMSVAQKLSSGENDLATHDVSGEWLATFGIGQTGVKNLPTLAPRTDAFWIPGATDCVDNDNAPVKAQSASGSQSTPSQGVKYCVNGKVIQPDASYWVVTGDHLMQDEQVYGTLSKLPDHDRFFSQCYLTEKIAQALEAGAHRHVTPCSRGHKSPGPVALQPRDEEDEVASTAAMPASVTGSAPSPTNAFHEVSRDIQAAEDDHQLRPMFHLEFGKLVGGLDLHHAVNGDSYVASNFQGVTDSRASAASQRELDIEQQMRGYLRFRNSPEQEKRLFGDSFGAEFRMGFQSDIEFDRSAQGNLTGKAENATFPLNSATGGLFVERDIYPGHSETVIDSVLRWIPPAMMTPGRFSLVFAPRQYQRQILGNYVYFPFSSTADGGGPKDGFELTIPTAPAYAFSDRLGFRETATTPAASADSQNKLKLFRWDSGSYWEAGLQNLDQRHVLQALTITTPDGGKSGQSVSVTCDAMGTLTFANCVKQIAVDGKSNFSNLVYADPTAWGFYWDVSLQKQLSPAKDQIHKVALQISSKGDRLLTLDLPLSTETRWDAPMSTAISFQILPNLSVAPTYNAFWYSNQVLHGHLFFNEGLITLRWYFNRDSMSPFNRQVLFNGPASDDQTKSMHLSKGGGS